LWHISLYLLPTYLLPPQPLIAARGLDAIVHLDNIQAGQGNVIQSPIFPSCGICGWKKREK